MTSKTCGCSTETCGCCEGAQKLTPASIFNRPGLDALVYRVGTHGTFFETMKAALAPMIVDAPGSDGQTIGRFQPLRGLTTRNPSDPAIALLDGWATIGDVLTFYQERIANEGYLRTATERRSILELARLVGYTLRPGVAATVYLAYTLEEKQVGPAEIPAGARSQSIPGPNEQPQSFETSDNLVARSEWNNLQVRLQRPQKITLNDARTVGKIYVAGANLNLKTGDLMMLVFEGKVDPVVRTVAKSEGQFETNRTEVQLQAEPDTAGSRAVTDPSTFVQSLLQPRIPQAASSLQLGRSLQSVLSEKADAQPQLLVNFAPTLKDSYYIAWANANVKTADQALKAIYVFRLAAPLFGASVARQPTYFTEDSNNNPISKATVTDPRVNSATVASAAADAHFKGQLRPQEDWQEWSLAEDEKDDALFLDQAHEAILPLSYVLINTLTKSGDTVQQVRQVLSTNTSPRTSYGLSGPTTRLKLDKTWRQTAGRPLISEGLRGTLVHGQSEELTLAEETITESVQLTIEDLAAGNGIALAELYNELTTGRWIILSGERADIPGVTGVKVSELLMISGLRQDYDRNLPGDKTHTTLLLATRTAYAYKRDTLTIYGNVVKATHGETRNETLGSGDGSVALQSFDLKQPPLTFVSSPTPSGVDSTLKVYVNDVEWHEADTLAGLEPKDRKFITRTADDDKTSVIFGNGKQGARLPTGVLNVKSIYRNGIGKGGNVLAEQISLLQTRPLGVKSVINPLRSSGGADKEDRDQARDNAPLAVMSLDRLVSVQDYADFTRTFAGIAKAAARRLSDGRRELVHLTIAGADDIPIDPVSDLYRNLVIALRKFGDASVAVRVDPRALVVLVISAKIRLTEDYQWDPVATEVRKTLLKAFGFQKRALGQAALLCEIIAAIQNVEGVAYVDVDTFGGIPETLDPKQLTENIQNVVNPGQDGSAKPEPFVKADSADFVGGVLHPAQLAIFLAAVPDTIVLNQIK